MTVRILLGDCLATLATLPNASVQCCVTSPPYYGLRNYGVAGQIGLEATPDAYVARLVEVFREVRRVLRNDGTLWLNIGDSYAGGGGGNYGNKIAPAHGQHATNVRNRPAWLARAGVKPKDLLMIPAMVAFALRADGWFLRADIIWHKPNPMPESVTDRPTSAHEHVFLLSKAERYFYDAAAIREPDSGQDHPRNVVSPVHRSEGHLSADSGIRTAEGRNGLGRNARNVWTIATQPYAGAHFATMPPELAERCIKAGTKPGDTVLDPFGGAGTTGLVADRLNRNAILCELNPGYADLARDRLIGDAPLLARVG